MNLEYMLIFCISHSIVVEPIIGEFRVKTQYGFVSSNLTFVTRNGHSYYKFLGIPYAAPPVGELRFEPPQPAKRWNGVRDAIKYGPMCTQTSHFKTLDVLGQEDCLYLNVFTPDLKPRESLLPVIVFIHGGMGIRESGENWSPDNFLDHPVVTVTFNYRLDLFGFLSSGDEVLPGNAAMKDQSAVLKWVQINIKKFGGDPLSVTLMGHSSGSIHATQHLFSKLSQGLFHKGVFLSGSCFFPCAYCDGNKAKSLLHNIITRANCTKETVEKSINCLKHFDNKRLKQISDSLVVTNMWVFQTVIEPKSVQGAFLTEDFRELNYLDPSNVPILVGTVSTEGLSLSHIAMIENQQYYNSDYYPILKEKMPISFCLQNWVTKNDAELNFNRMMDFYFNGQRHIYLNDLPKVTNIYGDFILKMPILNLVHTYPGKIYQYLYDYQTNHVYTDPYFGNRSVSSVGADHVDDLIVILRKTEGIELRISNDLIKYLFNFVKNGNPNGNFIDLPTWNEMKTSKFEYLHISEEGFKMKTVRIDEKRYEFYNSLISYNLKNASLKDIKYNNSYSHVLTDSLILLSLIIVIIY